MKCHKWAIWFVAKINVRSPATGPGTARPAHQWLFPGFSLQFVRNLYNFQEFLSTPKQSPEFARTLVNSREFVTFFFSANRKFPGNHVNFKGTFIPLGSREIFGIPVNLLCKLTRKNVRFFPRILGNRISGNLRFSREFQRFLCTFLYGKVSLEKIYPASRQQDLILSWSLMQCTCLMLIPSELQTTLTRAFFQNFSLCQHLSSYKFVSASPFLILTHLWTILSLW